MIHSAPPDPEHEVLLAAREAASLPADAVVPASALEDAVAEALGMAAQNRAAQADPDLEPDQRYAAGSAAFGQECVLRLFQHLLATALSAAAPRD